MKNNYKILYLTRWYPNRYDPMPGLFIRRHAEAVNRFCQVGVVYTYISKQEKIRGFDVDFGVINGIPTAKVYYNNPRYNIPVISGIVKGYRFFQAWHKGIKRVSKEFGDFDLFHIHILTRPGIMALWYKWVHGKPYVVSEHWSRYLSETDNFKGWFRKRITRLVVKNAETVITVTQNLADAMQSHKLRNKNYRVLANVVTDDFLNYPVKKNLEEKKESTFIHVSCFEDKSKNISGLLNMIRSMANKRNDFIFKLVGEGKDINFLKQYARDIGLTEETVVFTGLLEGKNLVKEMASAGLLVVFSNYENFPVVINESFALGIPVIATRVGGIPEFVNNSNGRLIDAGDEVALEKHLTDYLEGKLSFDNQKIRAESNDIFSPEKIGRELCDIYSECLIGQ